MSLMERLVKLGKLVSFMLILSVMILTLAAANPSSALGVKFIDRFMNSFCLITGLIGICAMVVLLPVQRAIQRSGFPDVTVGQVKTIEDQVKCREWDSNQVGLELAGMLRRNPLEGERVAKCLLAYGFPWQDLVWFAEDRNEPRLLGIVEDHQKQTKKIFQTLMIPMPIVALVVALSFPHLVRGFSQESWAKVFSGLVILFWLGGRVSVEKVLDLLKTKA